MATLKTCDLWRHDCPIEGAAFYVNVGEPCAQCQAEQPLKEKPE